MTEREQLEQAIAAQDALRPMLGDAVVDAAIAVLREKLASLDAVHSISEQRKQVTILFADTVSSTAMFEHCDPEDVLEMMDGALRIYTEAVDRLGGMVARLMGDGLLAFFGAPVGHEDDPVRAVRCGLAIIKAAQAYGRRLEAERQVIGYNVRVGINTGLVALGEVGSAAGSEYTAMGDAINLAARMEQAAPVGGVLISHDTYRHVRGLFEVRTLEPLQVKGKNEPVQVYVVEREKPRTFGISTRGVEGIETSLIGRETELRQLKRALNWAVEEGETQVVTITGEPGVGKSRLLREFDSWIDHLPENVLHFAGRATLEMANLPYALIRNVFAFRFEIHDSDSAAVVRAKLEQGIAGFMGPGSARKAPFIGQTIGYDFSSSPYLAGEEPQQVAQRGAYYLTEFFGAITADHPAVLFLEDIHWADDKSLDLVNYLVRSRRDLRLLVVCLARPTLFERRAPLWDERHEFHTLIELRPLSRDDSRQLVSDILRKADTVPDELQKQIVEAADGNPFYVEEIIKMLIDDRVIVKGADHWHIETERLTDIRIPPTLTGVLQARLDALPDVEQLVLQRASVIGRIFWDETLGHLRAEGDEPVENVKQQLDALCRRELIRRRDQSAFAGATEYIFSHSILRDVTYESVLRRLRRVYHGQVANWLADRSGDRSGEYIGLIAEHYERAGEVNKAVLHLRQAGEQALTISAYREAIASLERALNLLEDEEGLLEIKGQQAVLKGQLGQAYRGLSEYARARTLLAESLTLFREVGDSEGIVKALYELGWLVGYIMRQYDEGEQYFNEALHIAGSINDKRGIAWALNGLGVMAHWQGKFTDAIQHYERSLALAREIGDQARIAGALNNIGLVKGELGEQEEAGRYLEESLNIFKVIGNRAGVASPLTNLGKLARDRGQHELARELFAEALAIHEEIGNRAGVAGTLAGLGSLARTQGAYEEARQRFVESLAISREIDFRAGIAMSLEDLALIARFQGNYAEARQRLQEILRIARELNDRGHTAQALINLGAIMRVQGQHDEARELLEESLTIFTETDNQRGVSQALDSLGEVALAMGEYDRARDFYERSLAIHRACEDRSSSVVALGGLGDVFTAQGDYPIAREHYYEAFNAASAVRDTPLTLWVLTGIAGLLARTGEKERAAELLGLVLDHFATPREARDRAELILTTLRADLSAPTLNGALERGRLLENSDRHLLRTADSRWLA